MSPYRRLPCILATCVLAALDGQEPAAAQQSAAASSRAAPAADEERDLDAWLPGECPPGVYASRVVDAGSGRPIAGARVHLADETDHPLPGVWRAERTATSDADGFVSFTGLPEKGCRWLFVEAKGHALFGEMARPDAVELRPAFVVPIRFLTPLGDPARGAQIDLLLGCGHTPALRTYRADEQGTVRVDGTSAGVIRDLWPVLPGCFPEYVSLDMEQWNARAVSQPNAPIARLRPAPAIAGQVLDHQGKPAAGVAVGMPHCHRGPWTLTAADGTFTLVGNPEREELTVAPPGRTGQPILVSAPPPGVRRIVRLPAPGADEPPAEGVVALVVRCRDAQARGAAPGQGADPGAHVPVVAVRVADGATFRGMTDETGAAQLEVPAGELSVTAGAALGTFAPATQAVRIAAGKAAELAFALARSPTIRLVVEDLPETQVVEVTDGVTQIDVTAPVRSGEPVPVPAAGPLAVWLRDKNSGRQRCTPIPGPQRGAGAPPIVLEPLRPPVLRGRLVDARGKPTAGRVGVTLRGFPPGEADVVTADGDEAAGRFAMTPSIFGRLNVFAWFGPEDPARIVRVVAAELPDRDGAVVDLGDVAAPDRPGRTLAVLAADGGKLEFPPELHATRGSDVARVGIDDAGEMVQAGDRLRIVVEGHAAHVVTLAGEAPWVVRLPAGVIEITATDLAGQPLAEFLALLDDDTEARTGSKAASLRIAGVAAGEHRLWVYGGGHKPRHFRFTTRDGEQRRVVAKLRPR